MADVSPRQSPLAGMAGRLAAASAAGSRGVALREVPFLSQLGLRGDAAEPAFLAAIRRVVALDLPLQPNTTASGGPWTAYWLGPDEWLLVGPDGAAAGLERALHDALGDLHGSVVDVSAGRTVLEISGPRAREVLAKGCSLDLHPRSFGPGRCAQTLLARVQVILHQTGDEPAYRIFVRSSLARYLAAWLIDAVAEYRVGGAP